MAQCPNCGNSNENLPGERATMSNLILVTGATGTIGKEVVKQLTTKGARVRAFFHSPQNADAIQELGVEIALGDLGQPDSLHAALIGVEELFLLSPMDPRLAEWENNAIRAAQQAGGSDLCSIRSEEDNSRI